MTVFVCGPGHDAPTAGSREPGGAADVPPRPRPPVAHLSHGMYVRLPPISLMVCVNCERQMLKISSFKFGKYYKKYYSFYETSRLPMVI